ncbi:MAG: hypothetical protein AB7F99_12855 [Vicinamibacterales bacterium]
MNFRIPIGLAAVGITLLSVAAAGQEPNTAQTPEPAAPPEPVAESYTYEPAGRRDPFLNLMSSGSEQALPQTRPLGVAGLTTAELSVRGVVQSRTGLVAMVQGPDNRTYVVRAGDQLLDGTIKAVVPEGLVILQAVNDPLSLVKEREVRRLLRSLENGKERP